MPETSNVQITRQSNAKYDGTPQNRYNKRKLEQSKKYVAIQQYLTIHQVIESGWTGKEWLLEYDLPESLHILGKRTGGLKKMTRLWEKYREECPPITPAELCYLEGYVRSLYMDRWLGPTYNNKYTITEKTWMDMKKENNKMLLHYEKELDKRRIIAVDELINDVITGAQGQPTINNNVTTFKMPS